jgi:hypothetical protein
LTFDRSKKWQVTNTIAGTVTELTETTTATYFTMCPTSAGVTWGISLTCGERIYMYFKETIQPDWNGLKVVLFIVG